MLTRMSSSTYQDCEQQSKSCFRLLYLRQTWGAFQIALHTLCPQETLCFDVMEVGVLLAFRDTCSAHWNEAFSMCDKQSSLLSVLSVCNTPLIKCFGTTLATSKLMHHIINVLHRSVLMKFCNLEHNYAVESKYRLCCWTFCVLCVHKWLLFLFF